MKARTRQDPEAPTGAEQFAEYARREVEDWLPLTPEQRDLLAVLLRPPSTSEDETP